MNLVIIGAGGHGKVALEILRAARHRIIGFLDADESLAGQTVAGVKVLGGINQLGQLRRQRVAAAFVAIGDNRARLRCMRAVGDAGMKLTNAIHPTATVSGSATIGENVLIAAGAIVCTEARIGDGAILNTAAVVDHECLIDPGVHLCPAAALAGRVRVREGAFIGLGARVIQCLTIGEWSTVGAGAVVRQDVPPGQTVVGVPARTLVRPTASRVA
jgi:UDP-perosamine 4-acetyltransferase